MDRNELKTPPTKIILANASSFSHSNKSAIDEILAQRSDHREKIIKFCMNMGIASFLMVAIPIILQTYIRMDLKNKDFTIFDEYELEVLSTIVFAQIFGIIMVITKSLWDDSNYVDKIANENIQKEIKPLSIKDN